MAGLFREVDDDELPPGTPTPSPIKVHIEPKNYSGITIDTEYVPSSAILVWAQGSTWTVDYYAQALGTSVEPKPLDLHLSPIEQQYRLLRKVPLKVTEALSWTMQDAQSTVMVGTGGGYTYPFMPAQVGDMFVANVGDGRVGLFTITSSTPATVLRDSVYKCEWIMVSLAEPLQMENLASKIIQTMYFSQNSLEGGCGPFVTSEELARIESYQETLQELIRRYFTDFLSLDHFSLLVPDQIRKTYDHFVVKAMLKMISPQEEPRIRKVREQNVMGDLVMKQPTIYDAVLRGDPVQLYGSTERVHLVSTANFRGSPLLQAIGYTGIPYIVYPQDAPTDVDSQYDQRDVNRPVGLPMREGRPRRPEPGEYRTQAERDPVFFRAIPDDVVDIPIWKKPATIHPVVTDDFYVLSEAFYREGLGQSKLELLVRQFLNRESLHEEQFNDMLATVYDWDNLERYYYHPLVIALLKTKLR
ncbi:hypothetical protein D3C84_61230 [compost metagenome]